MGQGASGSGSSAGGTGGDGSASPMPSHRRGGVGGAGHSSGGGGGGSDVLGQLTRQARLHRRDSLAALTAALETDAAASAAPREIIQFPLLPAPPTTLLEKALSIMQRGDVFTKYSYTSGAPKMIFLFFSTGPSDSGVSAATAADFEFGNLYWNANRSEREWEQWMAEEDEAAVKERRAVQAAARGEATPAEPQPMPLLQEQKSQHPPQPQPAPAAYPFPAPVAASYPFGGGGGPGGSGGGPATAAYPFPAPAAYPFAAGSNRPAPSAAAYPFSAAAAAPPRPLERSKSRYARCALRSIALVSVIQVSLGAERTAITSARAALPVVAQDPWAREEGAAADSASSAVAAADNAPIHSSLHPPTHAASAASSAGRFYSGSSAPAAPPLSPSYTAAAPLPLDPQYPSQAPGFPSHALSQGFGRWTQAPWMNVLSYRQAQKRRRERRKQRRRAVREKRLAGMHIPPEEEVSSDSDDDGWLLAGNTGGAGAGGGGGSLGDEDEDDEEDLPTYTYRPPPLAHCMSIATPDRTLDLVARDASTRDVWAYGLRWLASRTERYFNHNPGLSAQETQYAQRMSVAEALGLTQAMRERIQERRDQKGLVGRIKKVGKAITRGVGGLTGGGGGAGGPDTAGAESIDEENAATSGSASARTTPPRLGRPGSTEEFKSSDAGGALSVRPGLDRTASVESTHSFRGHHSRAASLEMVRPGLDRTASTETALVSLRASLQGPNIAPSIAPLFGSRYSLITAPRTIASRENGCEITISARHLTTAGGTTIGAKSPASPSSASPGSPSRSSNFSPCILLYGLQRKYIPGVTAMSAEKFYASLRTSRPTSSGSEIRGVGLALDERVVFLGKTERVGPQDCVAFASFRATNSSSVPPSSTAAEYGAPLSLSPSHPNFVTTLLLPRLDDFDEFHFVCHDASEMDALENAMLARSGGGAEGDAKRRGSIIGGAASGPSAGVLSPRMLRASLISSPLGLPGAAGNSMADQLRSFSQGLQQGQTQTQNQTLAPSSPPGKRRGGGASSTGNSGTATPAVSDLNSGAGSASSAQTSLFTLHSLQACPVVGWLRLKVDDLLLNMGRELVAPLGVPGQPPSVALLTKHFLPPPPTLRSVRALASASAAATMMGRGSVLQQNLSASRGSILNQTGEWGGGGGGGGAGDLASGGGGSSDMFVKDSEGRTLVTDAMLDAYKVAVLDREARRDARQKVAQAAAARVARQGGSASTTLMRQSSLQQEDQAHSNLTNHVTVRSQVSPLMLLKIRPVAAAPALLSLRSGGGIPRSRDRSRNNSNAHEFLTAAAEVTAAAESAAAAEAAEREAKHQQRMKHRMPLIYPPGHQRAQSHEETRARVTSLSDVLSSPTPAESRSFAAGSSSAAGSRQFPHRRRHTWSGFDAGLRMEKVLLARPPLPQSDPLGLGLGESAGSIDTTLLSGGGSMSLGDASYRDTDRGGGGNGSSSSAGGSNASSLASTNRTQQQQQMHHIVQIEDPELDLDDEDDDEEESEGDAEVAGAAEASVPRPFDSPATVAARLYPQRALLDPQRRGREAPAHSPFPHEELVELAEKKAQEVAAAAAGQKVSPPRSTTSASASAHVANSDARPASPSAEPPKRVGTDSPVLLASPSAVQGRSTLLLAPTAAPAASGSAAPAVVPSTLPTKPASASSISSASSSSSASALPSVPSAVGSPAAVAAPEPTLGSDDLIASLQARMRKLQEASKARADAQRGAASSSSTSATIAATAAGSSASATPAPSTATAAALPGVPPSSS